MMLTNVGLAARLAMGDEAAVAWLLDCHGKALNYFILNLTDDVRVVSGIFNATLHRLSAMLAAGQQVGDPKKALFHAAYGLITSSRRRRRSGMGRTGSTQVIRDGSPDDWSLVSPELQTALACLPLSQRLVVELRYLHRFSESDIAQITGLPLPRVEARLERARVKLAPSVL